jgi:tetratricopeptide (TPR) repeat protein
MEILSGSVFGGSSGVAHWAHVGGFVFGVLAALAIRYSGVQQQASEAIDKKVSWTADPLIAQAGDLMEHGKVDEAIAKLTEHLKTKPDSVDARAMLQQLYWRKGDTVSYQNEIVKLCQLHLKSQDKVAAWHDFEEFQNSGGEKLPAATWLELCRYLEEQQNFDRAVSEYEKLATAWPAEKPSLLALMAAGRLSLKKLGRPAEALHLYRAASASPVPHLDWESNIQAGIKEATATLSQSAVHAE